MGADVEQWQPLRPNVLITGTPGVGKSTLCEQLSRELGLQHIDVGAFARERDLLAEHDTTLDAHFLHEDAVLDALEPLMYTGGIIVDHHSCDWFPQRWFQLAFVLRASTHILFDRLQERKYPPQKRDHNVQAEIMQVVLEETVNAYPQLHVAQLVNDTDADQLANITTIKAAWDRLLLDQSTTDSQRGHNHHNLDDVVH